MHRPDPRPRHAPVMPRQRRSRWSARRTHPHHAEPHRVQHPTRNPAQDLTGRRDKTPLAASGMPPAMHR